MTTNLDLSTADIPTIVAHLQGQREPCPCSFGDPNTACEQCGRYLLEGKAEIDYQCLSCHGTGGVVPERLRWLFKECPVILHDDVIRRNTKYALPPEEECELCKGTRLAPRAPSAELDAACRRELVHQCASLEYLSLGEHIELKAIKVQQGAGAKVIKAEGDTPELCDWRADAALEVA